MLFKPMLFKGQVYCKIIMLALADKNKVLLVMPKNWYKGKGMRQVNNAISIYKDTTSGTAATIEVTT